VRRREPVGRLETHPAAHHANSLGRDRKAIRRRNNRRGIGHQDLASPTDAAPTLSPDVRSGAPVRVNCCMANALCRWSSAFVKERRCPKDIPVGFSPPAACSCAPIAGCRSSFAGAVIAATAIAVIAPEKPAAPVCAKPAGGISAAVVDALLMRRERDATGLNAKS
jgi:hypothetical protein